MKIAAVIVAHRSNQVLPGLLNSLARHEPGIASLVVDNASPEALDLPDASVEVHRSNVNRGFGAACNEGARYVFPHADAVAFLNPDVRLAGPSLTELANQFAEHPDIGVATGPVVDEHGVRQPSAWGPTSPLRAFWYGAGWQMRWLRRWLGRFAKGSAATSGASLAHDELEVDGHVLGGAMVVRRECWEQLGGFDEDFFLYWEDADLCQRARAGGWRVAVLPCTPIVHMAGTSSAGVTNEHRWGWYVEGAERFAEKHLTPARRRRLLFALRSGRRVRR